MILLCFSVVSMHNVNLTVYYQALSSNFMLYLILIPRIHYQTIALFITNNIVCFDDAIHYKSICMDSLIVNGGLNARSDLYEWCG